MMIVATVASGPSRAATRSAATTFAPGGGAGEERLLAGQPPGHGLGLVGGDGEDLVHLLGLPQRRDEADADPLDLVRAGGLPGEDGRLLRLHRHHAEGRGVTAQRARRAVDGRRGAHRVDKGVDAAARLLPHLVPEGVVPGLAVRVVQLVRPPVGAAG